MSPGLVVPGATAPVRLVPGALRRLTKLVMAGRATKTRATFRGRPFLYELALSEGPRHPEARAMIYRCWTERKRIAGEQNRVLFHCHENLWEE